ncbi:MAG: hypothetical protein CK425_01395 [Parachlamydia sp.]|nr:MAG: hypothetical protein CK425_01395 [Parachlamydia sp.]
MANSVQKAPFSSEKNHSFGENLQQRTQKLLNIASALKEISSTHGTDMICSGNTIVAGLTAILNSGNLFSLALNTGLVIVGGKRVYNILQDIKPSSSSDALGELLREVQAGIGVLQIHGEINSGTLHQLEKTLEAVEERSHQIEKTIQELKATSVRGKADLELKQKAAFEFYTEANALYRKSRLIFSESQQKMTLSSKLFASAMVKFEQVKALAHSQEGSFQSRASELETLVETIARECEEAKKLMNEANDGLATGLAQFDAATALMTKAAFEFGQLKEGASEEFAALESLANELIGKNKQSQQDLARMKELVDDIATCCEDCQKILAEMEAENKKAQEMHQGYSTGAVIAGGLAAGLTAGMGTLPLLAGAFLAAQAYERKETVAKKVGDWAFNIPSGIDQNLLVKPYEIGYAFDRASSGSFNRYIKQEKSYTTGTLKIHLGDEILSLRFDFRQRNVLSKMDLFKLQNRMSHHLIKSPNAKTAAAYAEILRTLEELEIDRGPQGNSKGLLTKNSPYFSAIQRLCTHILSKEELNKEVETAPLAPHTIPKEVKATEPSEPVAEKAETLASKKFSHLTAIGETACQATKTTLAVAILLSKTATFTRKHGTDVITSGTTLVHGLYGLGAAIASGGTLPALVGVGLTVAGAKRVYEIIQDIKNPDSPESLSDLLENSEAGIAMLQTIGESQSEILFQMDKTLNSAEKLAMQTSNILKDIEGIAVAGKKELEMRKEKALGLYEKAQTSFAEARRCYEEGKQKMDASSEYFTSALAKFRQLSQLVQNRQGNFKEQTAAFLKLTLEMDQECQQGKQLMDDAHALLGKGTKLSDTASVNMSKAAFEFGQLKERASEKFTTLENKANQLTHTHAESIKKIATMKGHVKEMQANLEDSNRLVADIEKDNQKAQKMSQGFTTGAMLMGGVIGGIATAGLGIVAGAAVSLMTAALYENKTYIARKVCDWAFRTPMLKGVEATPVKKYNLSFSFEQISTGFFNRYIKKEASQTVGSLRIDLGDKIATFLVDFNKPHPLSKADQCALVATMNHKLARNPELAPHYLAILQKVESLQVQRGGKLGTQSIVKKENLQFASLKRYCRVLLKAAA